MREQVDKDMEEIYDESYYQKRNVSTRGVRNSKLRVRVYSIIELESNVLS